MHFVWIIYKSSVILIKKIKFTADEGVNLIHTNRVLRINKRLSSTLLKTITGGERREKSINFATVFYAKLDDEGGKKFYQIFG